MFKNDLLAGKKILITGGGTGLGKSIGRRYLELGAHLVICGRRKEVLDCLDRHRFARQAGLELAAADVRDRGGDFETTQVGALEPDTVVSRRGLEGERDLVAGMKANTGARDGTTKGSLRLHGPLYWGLGSRSWLSKPAASALRVTAKALTRVFCVAWLLWSTVPDVR